MSERLPSAEALGLVRLEHRALTASTMDDAHAIASAGGVAGTLVVADAQGQGRGRGGHSWASEDGAGLWMTLLERPRDSANLGVLALRAGLAVAAALDPFVSRPVTVKWPNDLFVGRGKVAGILIEARWRDVAVDWVAIGVGVNMRVPTTIATAAAVEATVTRNQLLHAIVPALRAVALRSGPLSDTERAAWTARDLAIGRAVSAPVAGIVMGVAEDGALLVSEAGRDQWTAVHAGSLVLASPAR